MAEQVYEFTGKTVDEAISEGLSELGMARDRVDVEILSQGSRGIFGIGSEPARVEIRPHPASTSDLDLPSRALSPVDAEVSTEPDEMTDSPSPAQDAPSPESPDVAEATLEEAITVAESEATIEESLVAQAAQESIPQVDDDELALMARDMLGEMVHRMGFEATIASSWKQPDEGEGDLFLLLDISGGDLGALIGRRGETLASMQYLVRLMVNQRIKQWKNIVVDVEKYKERRVAQLTQLALRMADQVSDSGRAVALEPMPPNERRIVHLALRDHPAVYTQSSGEGDRRKVHIVAKDIA